MTRSTNVTEQDAFEGTVAEEPGLVRGVKLLGLRSKNRRNYDTPGVTRSAPHLLNGARVYIDHPATPETPRSYRDAFGVVEAHEYKPGMGHFGNIRYNPEHPLAKQFAWDVKNNPTALGMSINAKIRPGKTDRNGDVLVESLEMVRSIDVVTRPGTAEGIFESDSSEDEIMDLKTLKEKHSDLLEQVLEEERRKGDATSEASKLAAQLKEAQEQLQSLKAEQEATARRLEVTKEITEALAGSAIAADAELVKEVIECACEMSKEGSSRYSKVLSRISKISPMLEETDEDEDIDAENDAEDQKESEDADEQAKAPAKPAYRPKARPVGKGSVDLAGMLGLKKG